MGLVPPRGHYPTRRMTFVRVARRLLQYQSGSNTSDSVPPSAMDSPTLNPLLAPRLHERGEVVTATVRTKALTTTLLVPHEKPHLACKPFTRLCVFLEQPAQKRRNNVKEEINRKRTIGKTRSAVESRQRAMKGTATRGSRRRDRTAIESPQ